MTFLTLNVLAARVARFSESSLGDGSSTILRLSSLTSESARPVFKSTEYFCSSTNLARGFTGLLR